MAAVIHLCKTCGFDIPVDAADCPSCSPRTVVEPPLAALQVAGLALPTRSVRRLRSSPALRAHPVRPVGRARTARSVFSFTFVLALVTFAAAGLAWLAARPRFVLDVPSGTAELLDDITYWAAAASVVGLGVGPRARRVWCSRRGVEALVERFDHRPVL